jgi:cytochrome c
LKPRHFLLPLPLLLAAGALAAGIRDDDAARGHALARAWCASCHAVEPGAPEGPFADVPSFTAIARLPTTTSSALHAFLSTPHGDMPDIKLKSGEIDAVVAYILSLKDK